ncbi:T3SS effector HopA1 family protein [Mastigocladopsis repens]|uniref:T3SS effector HopA1 family protein n=1 Tax=Mastigocladopsis repens TaxID=221287 RepID=UPI0002EF90A3|nr:T3SS effector HopA1 family protein [Mastigocladopsis repens]
MLESYTKPLLNSLLEIAGNIQIESSFCIRHPKYQPFALPSTIAERFRQNSPALQHKYLALLLRNFIHGIYYNGSLQNTLSLNGDRMNDQSHKNVESHSIWEMDCQFYEQLHNSNHGTGYFDPGWQVLRREPDGSIAVTKGGLTLYVEYNSNLESATQTAKVGAVIDIWMPKNRLQNGFYVAVSNVGQDLQSNPDAVGTGRIYFNVTPFGAIALMDNFTQQLNAAAIPFNFQVLHNPSAYGRYDSGVLSFECEDYSAVRKVLQAAYAEHQSHFHKEIPLFTKFLAPGLSLAEEPSQKFAAQESFGINRCQIVANALLEVWQQGNDSTEERIRAIQLHFARFGIDLQRPYLNPSSEDIYYPLN